MMRNGKLFVLAVAVSVAITATIAGQQAEDQPKPVGIEMYYGFEKWILSPTVTDDPKSKSPGVTHSVLVRVRRAINPLTSQPYDLSEPIFEFDPEDIKHMFRLEKKEFLLGEPILVEHRIELNGSGEWSWFVGGNYRTRGRDDNFYFILRSLDGTIVPDRYPKLDGPQIGGGLGSNHTIKNDKPLSYWLGLQRYAAITEPGVYDLFCMTTYQVKSLGRSEAISAELPEEVARDHYVNDDGSLIDRTTGQVSLKYEVFVSSERDATTGSPLSDLLPLTGRHPGVVAKFRITIREGTKPEQQLMVDHWTKVAGPNTTRDVMGGYKGALSDAMWYAQQDHFLPLFEKWIRNTIDRNASFLDGLQLEGLAMRSDIAAFKLLRLASPAAMVSALYRLQIDRIPDAIPICIALLTHENGQVRWLAESYLSSWTCQAFERAWEGSNQNRPTLNEGKKMQPLWQAWWDENKKGYVPRNPSRLLCKEPEL